ncbi:alpha/beta fold hydrolase [Nocardiopsis sp. NPDC050513]|uniref:alpha/beta fold hydrolase n=1 Tax=Nocardiopsis sp. NPDC050513 TaxID=3364338 RepID=UPI00379D8556
MADILLVHGAAADGSGWNEVIRILLRRGHNPVAAQLPLTSVPDDEAVVRRAIDRLGGPVVVVGHSFGGLVITQAAHHNARVGALVYVAAFALEQGESVVDVINTRYPEPTPPERVFVFDRWGYFTVATDEYPTYFAPDIDPDMARIHARTQGPADAARFEFAGGPPGWREHPSWYVVAGNDRMIHPAAEAWMAERAGARTTTVPGASHAVFASHPQEVADVIVDAASTL